jgi:hypothetical protein
MIPDEGRDLSHEEQVLLTRRRLRAERGEIGRGESAHVYFIVKLCAVPFL